jgi:hypothetical protein
VSGIAAIGRGTLVLLVAAGLAALALGGSARARFEPPVDASLAVFETQLATTCENITTTVCPAPVPCDASTVPVNRCRLGCADGAVSCSNDGGCCRCERPCYPRHRPN